MAQARAERRLAAILAADVAGYSRLMGANEVRTLANPDVIFAHAFTDPSLGIAPQTC